MKYIKLKYVLILLFSLFFAVIFWNFFNILSFADSGFNFEGKSKQEKIYPNLSIIQKIKTTDNNFSQVNISVSKFSPKLGDKITLEVKDESCEKVLAKSKIGKLTWSSPNYEKFKFSPIFDSRDKTYCLQFTYIPKQNEQNKKIYLSSYISEESSYINTGKSIEEQKNRTLELKPAYENGSASKNFSKLIDRMSQYKPDYFKRCSLEILFISSFAIIISLFIIMVILI